MRIFVAIWYVINIAYVISSAISGVGSSSTAATNERSVAAAAAAAAAVAAASVLSMAPSWRRVDHPSICRNDLIHRRKFVPHYTTITSRRWTVEPWRWRDSRLSQQYLTDMTGM